MNIIFLLCSVWLTGCLSLTPMPFADSSKTAVIADKPVYLMSVSVKNIYRTWHQPDLLRLTVEDSKKPDRKDHIQFKVDSKGTIYTTKENLGNSYLMRMELANGAYVIRGSFGMSSSFPIHGFYFLPIHAKLNATEPGIYYLGHVEAVIRERKDNEFRAGPMIPLIDQAVAGASGGTFDVEISDLWATDEKRFTDEFQALKGQQIKKAILPAFDKKMAYEWWDKN